MNKLKELLEVQFTEVITSSSRKDVLIDYFKAIPKLSCANLEFQNSNADIYNTILFGILLFVLSYTSLFLLCVILS